MKRQPKVGDYLYSYIHARIFRVTSDNADPLNNGTRGYWIDSLRCTHSIFMLYMSRYGSIAFPEQAEGLDPQHCFVLPKNYKNFPELVKIANIKLMKKELNK